MMDLQTIAALNRDIGEQARQNGLTPHILSGREVAQAQTGNLEAIRSIPNLGYYLPKGWQRVSLADLGEGEAHGVYMGDNEGFGAYMVDKSGFGRRDEPALTLDQFVERLRPGYGYAMVEEGQFQVKIGLFERTH